MFLGRGFALPVIAAAILVYPWTHSVEAAVVATGNVTPAPPAGGGNVAGPFIVGDATLGTLAINSATPLTVTSGSMTVADDLNSIGAVSMTGFGSNLSINSDLLLANRGVGTFVVRSQALLSTADDLEVGVLAGSNGTLIIEDLGSLIDVGDDAVIGSAGVGVVELLNGGRAIADITTIGRLSGSSGRLTIDGPNSQWRQSGVITVGDLGQGMVQISGQGQLITGAAEIGKTGPGAASISGSGSLWNTNGTFAVGVGGYGALDVLNGARVANTAATRIGQGSAGDGRVQVSGAGSVWATGTQLTIGDSGDGALRILSGGRVTSSGAVIGASATGRGEVTVDGVGSAWDMTGQSGQLLIGNTGRGYLMIANDGLVSTNSAITVSATGELRLAGGRLQLGENLLTNQGLTRGSGRIDGAVTNSPTGEVRVLANETLSIAQRLTNNGNVNIDGGELEIGRGGVGAPVASTNNLKIAIRDGVLRMVGPGLENNSGAQLAITGGEVDIFGAINNKSGAQIVVGGGATAVFHDTLTNTGQLYVFPGADVLMLKNLSFSSSTLLGLQLGAGDLTDEMGQVEVAGQATLAGTLSVELTGGFAPALGNSFSLLTASSGVSGTFSTTNLPALGAGLAWDLDYSSNAVSLSVVAGSGLSADFDNDGNVDADDLALWKIGFGKSPNALPSDGDANGDGRVDGSDFLAWQRQFGTPPSAPAARVAPEPTGVGLLASALAVAAFGVRRRAKPQAANAVC